MGEAFLVAFLQVLVDKLAHRDVLTYFGLVKGVDQKLKKWSTTLTSIQAVLSDAEDMQLNEAKEKKTLKLWLDDLRDLAYDVEDLLDKFATKMLKREIEQGHQPTTRSKLWSSIPDGVFNFKMNSEIQKITERLQEISQRKDQLSLNDIGASSTKSRQNLAPSTSQLLDGPVIGRGEDKRQIFEFLSKEEHRTVNFDVVAIVGMAGLGKTTLAVEVLNDIDEAHLSFNPKVWVRVSDDFNLERVTKQILDSITSEHKHTTDFNQVQNYLHKELAGKKFFIVLDDVWEDTCSYGQWMKLQSPLRDGAPGSKILVTTRHEKVSKMMGAGNLVHNLKPLSNDDCLEVFEKHAFLSANNCRPPNYELLKEMIVQRCRGLPLAARTLGGLLLSKETDEWEEILNNKLWSLFDNSDILPVLRLSYHYLPSHLKRCFAYCSILPNDYEFEKQQLILLWIAEGLVQQHSEDKTQMEDLSLDYFQELLSRSLFQKSSNNNSRYIMHDLVNDLARWAAGNICFRLEDKQGDDLQLRCFPMARHSSFIPGEFDGAEKFESFAETKRLRTFLPFSLSDSRWLHRYLSRRVTFDILPKLQYLRVLSFNGYQITELPNSIGKLRYLRYLDLSYTRIRSLPKSITALYNLQTLILEGCSNLKALPAKMRSLINLRHLNNSDVSLLEGMPPQFGRLANLRSLPNFVVGKGSEQSGIREMGLLSHLQGRLCLSRLENVIDADDARKADLTKKGKLDALVLGWSYSRETRETESNVLEMLRPHRNLKELTIRGYGGKKFSTWVGLPSFSNVVSVCLEGCNNCLLLPALGQLPSLKELHIKGMDAVESVGPEFYGGGISAFQVLETLEFQDMQSWKEWLPFEQCGERGVFRCLKTLSIENCQKLEGWLPENVDSLAKLEIVDCGELVVSIANYKEACELNIQGCKAVEHTTADNFELLESLYLSNITELRFEFQTGELMKGILSKVKTLRIGGCEELTSSMKNEDRLLQELVSLGRLDIEGNSGLVEKLGKEAEELVELRILDCKLEYLELRRCESLSKVPIGLHHLASLQELHIWECSGLVVVFGDIVLPPSLKVISIDTCDALIHFAKSQIPPNVTRVVIRECKSLKALLEKEGKEVGGSSSSSYSSLISLEYLEIWDCESLTSLSLRGQFPRALKHLRILSCQQLELITSDGFSFSHDNTNCLESIYIWSCPNLKCLPEGLCHLTHLQTLSIWDCGSLVSIPRLSANLGKLNIYNCDKLEELPDMHHLTSLQELGIEYREGFTSFPPNLISLSISKVKSCKPLWDELHRLTSLRELLIVGEDPDVVSFPPDKVQTEMLLPKSLTKLTINGFPNLKKLGKGFQFSQTSLQSLTFRNCPKLASIPEEGLPLSLTQLSISDCPLLEEKCIPGSKGRRSYWPKISHIPYIWIDLVVI